MSSLVNLNPPAGSFDNVTDADSGAVTGIALTGTNNSDGTWYYSTNNGGSWTAVGSVSNGQALLLAANVNSRLYFQANSQFQWQRDRRRYVPRLGPDERSAGTKVDTTGNGGSTAFLERDRYRESHGQSRQRQSGGTNDILYVSNSTTVTLSAQHAARK